MSGPWPNQTPAQEGFGYPRYPEQYPQQQYGPPSQQQYGAPSQQPYGPQAQQQYSPPPQQYQYGPPQNSYQQYGQPQPEPYQQPFQQQPVQTYKQNIAKPSPQTCYNCGSPEHWAQNCPEPRREVPAGDMARQSVQRPVKKFRPDYIPPVITKYAVPPHVQAMHGTTPGYGGQTYPQPAAQAYQTSYGQPTPLSAQHYGQPTPYSAQPYGHPHYQQWPENQQQHAQAESFQRRNTYPQQLYNGYGPTPYYPPGQQYASPVSAHGAQQYSGLNPPYNTGEQHQGPQYVSYASASPGVPQSPYEAAQLQAGLNSGGIRPNSASRSRSMTQSVTPGVQQAVAPEDTNEELDLALLDIPDLPTIKGGDGIRLVQYPLPALIEDLEAIGGPLPFPSPSSMGFVKSRYVDKETYESQIWDLDCERAKLEMKEDPIFSFDKNNHTRVLLDTLRDNHGRKTIGELYPETTNASGDLSADLYGSESSYDRASDRPSPQDTERRLAALGVTGVAKPVRAPARPYPPPNARRPPSPTSPPRYDNGHRYSRYSGGASIPDNRSPRDHDPLGHRGRSASPPYVRNHTPQPQPDPSPHNDRDRTPAYDNPGTTFSTSRQHDPYDPRDNNDDRVGYVRKTSPADVRYDAYNPPPPPQSPPPPLKRSSDYGLSRNDSTIPGLKQNPYDIYSPAYIEGHHQAGSATKNTPEKANHRKRTRDHRDDSDDERDNDRRRQYDDVTPKLKRRQPDVPEAYGRRW